MGALHRREVGPWSGSIGGGMTMIMIAGSGIEILIGEKRIGAMSDVIDVRTTTDGIEVGSISAIKDEGLM